MYMLDAEMPVVDVATCMQAAARDELISAIKRYADCKIQSLKHKQHVSSLSAYAAFSYTCLSINPTLVGTLRQSQQAYPKERTPSVDGCGRWICVHHRYALQVGPQDTHPAFAIHHMVHTGMPVRSPTSNGS
jgi:hypothetical protein